ncbi:hypothetical protein BDV06DRAFT_200710 [Aspergillus oleicola]
MPLYNTQAHFLYRQFFLTPSTPSSTFSLAGKSGLITGSNTGIGYQAASQLLSLGLSRLILVVRSVSKGNAAKKELLASLPKTLKTAPVVEVWELDLSNYASIVAFVDRLKSEQEQGQPDKKPLDFAILNAGLANFQFAKDESTGNEESIQVNWLGTALLTILLLPVLDHSDPSRSRPTISIVGSETAAWAKFKEASTATKEKTTLLSVLNDERNFVNTDRYYTSKLLQQLFFLELVRRRKQEHGAILNLVNPGFCYGSELHRGAPSVVGKVLGGVKRVIGRSAAMGARTLVHAAVLAGPESDGKFLSDNRVAPFAGYGDSEQGRKIQEMVWQETVGELVRVVGEERLVVH